MLKLCGFHISNYFNKVRIAMLEKGVRFELDPTCRPSQAEDFLARTPMGKVPFLEIDGAQLCESQVICEYLEDAYPERPLYPRDALERAKVRELITLMELHVELVARRLYGEVFFGRPGSEEIKQATQKDLVRGIRAVGMLRRKRDERQMHERGAVGEREIAARDVGVEPGARAQRADASDQVFLRRLLDLLASRPAEEHFTVEPPGNELDVQLHQGDELAHLGALEGIARIERALRIGVLEVLADHLRLAQLGAVDLEEGHLAHGRAREEVLGLRGPAGRVELEPDALFQHRDAHLVEVVADVEAAELEHRLQI